MVKKTFEKFSKNGASLQLGNHEEEIDDNREIDTDVEREGNDEAD